MIVQAVIHTKIIGVSTILLYIFYPHLFDEASLSALICMCMSLYGAMFVGSSYTICTKTQHLSIVYQPSLSGDIIGAKLHFVTLTTYVMGFINEHVVL